MLSSLINSTCSLLVSDTHLIPLNSIEYNKKKKMWGFIWLLQILLYVMQYQVGFLSSQSTVSSTNYLCPHDQKHALLQFKQYFAKKNSASFSCDHIGFPSYPKMVSWNENSSDCCLWDGVTCDGFTGHVIGLDLSFSQLCGTIHPNSTLYQLSHLQMLNLSFNDFQYSHISTQIGNLASLTHLNLSFSKFSGSIPSEISQLSKLVSLHMLSSEDGLLRLEQHNFRKLVKNLTHLHDLNLFQVNISSGLPDSLMNLSSLSTLDLRFTKLQGDLPHDILHLPNLQELHLSGNNDLFGMFPMVNRSGGSNLRKLDLGLTSLSGEVPDSIGHLKSLSRLNLCHCKFLGYIPKSLGNLTQITYLDLSWNNFSGQVPSTLSNLKQLIGLVLAFNNLEGTIPDSFGKLTQLVFLDVSNNSLTGPIPLSISKLVNLTSLSLSSNNLSGVVELHVFLNLKKLVFLDLSFNNLSVIARSTNGTLPNLSTLHLSSCNINEFPDFLRSLKNLQKLDLSYNKIHGRIPKWVGQAPMSYFFISHNKLIGDIPSSICNLTSLEILDFSYNNMTGVIPNCLGNSSNLLSVLDLRMNGFHGTIPTTFAMGSHLRNLNLNRNHLEGQVSRSLANCRHLEVLDLGNNKLNDTFPYWLESLPELQVLVLRLNRFHGPINTSRTKVSFPKLRIIDLSHNEFTGLLPARYFRNFKAMWNVDENKTALKYMGEKYCQDSVTLVIKGFSIELLNILSIFTTIDFSNNKFQGEIPSIIGRLQALRLLNVSHNFLTGPIPTSLGNILMLESLDLSSNQLNGEIPGQLTGLTFLAVLNLSKNHLVGPIPQGNQFNTFQNDSYVGNIGLCGLPLSKQCGDSEAKHQPPLAFQQEEEGDTDLLCGFSRKAVLMGYGCGLALGLVMGHVMFLIGKPKWLARIVGREQHRNVKRLKLIGYKWGSRRNHQTQMEFSG